MKLIEKVKSLELLIFVAIASVCFYMIVVKSNIYHLIAESRELQLVCILLWASLFAAFIFIFLDLSLYTKQKKAINALDYAAHSDNLAKIANRQGIDEVIDKYIDEDLPENLGCAMFVLVSLNDINKNHTRADGNTQIRNFSIILKLASVDVCFVGRNGGNVFMAIFENANPFQVDSFMARVNQKVKEYNRKKDNLPMYYQVGLAYHEDESVRTINDLISLASKRSRESDTIPKLVEKTETTAKTEEAEKTEGVISGEVVKIEDFVDDYFVEPDYDYHYSNEELSSMVVYAYI